MVNNVGTMGWTTSYQAGPSNSDSPTSTDSSDSEDDFPQTSRGRTYRQTTRDGKKYAVQRPESSSLLRGRRPSRSPITLKSRTNQPVPSPTTPGTSNRTKHMPLGPRTYLFPALIELGIRVPFAGVSWVWSIDTRRLGECLILLASYLYALKRLSSAQNSSDLVWPSSLFVYSKLTHPLNNIYLATNNLWIIIETLILGVASFLYIIWTHSTLNSTVAIAQTPRNQTANPHIPARRDSQQRSSETRESRRGPVATSKSDFGFIWMSVPKNYRESSDDGVMTGLLLGPLIAIALLYRAQLQLDDPPNILPPLWRIESPSRLVNGKENFTVLEALILSRYNLVDLATLCSWILLFHICASWWLESRYPRPADAPEGERRSVPRSEGRRSWFFVLFTISVCITTIFTKILLDWMGVRMWQHIGLFDSIICSLFYQFTLYVAIRLAHRGFTLGELGLVSFGGAALFMEFLHITIARIWPVTTPYMKTYRLPTPLLTFQTALIAGSFLTGFLLSPFLILSRHIAQRPARRLRNPEQKLRQRRLLALGFYVGTILIVGGMIGMWTRWCLGKRDPWVWVIFWLLDGRKKWSRPALLGYWAAVGSLSLAGWSRQLARSRKYRVWSAAGENLIVPWTTNSGPSQNVTEVPAGSGGNSARPPSPIGLTLPNGSNVSHVATDLLDAADKHVPTLKLNARRKFFHALAVAMFVPGIAFDPAFTHLAFSAAFALFIFAEYVRYFAIYPFGAVIHLFMNEFLDHKDSGTAILSHFYLLTGCAGSLWLDPSTRLIHFTGILILGVGDAMASIVGKKIGVHRWSPSTSKTIEGSVAYVVSILMFAWLLRLCRLLDDFSTLCYFAVICVSSTLEAFSDQNDNLTLPLYTWSMLIIANV